MALTVMYSLHFISSYLNHAYLMHAYLIVENIYMYNFKSCRLISRIPIIGTDGDHIALLIISDL